MLHPATTWDHSVSVVFTRGTPVWTWARLTLSMDVCLLVHRHLLCGTLYISTRARAGKEVTDVEGDQDDKLWLLKKRKKNILTFSDLFCAILVLHQLSNYWVNLKQMKLNLEFRSCSLWAPQHPYEKRIPSAIDDKSLSSSISISFFTANPPLSTLWVWGDSGLAAANNPSSVGHPAVLLHCQHIGSSMRLTSPPSPL